MVNLQSVAKKYDACTYQCIPHTYSLVNLNVNTWNNGQSGIEREKNTFVPRDDPIEFFQGVVGKLERKKNPHHLMYFLKKNPNPPPKKQQQQKKTPKTKKIQSGL